MARSSEVGGVDNTEAMIARLRQDGFMVFKDANELSYMEVSALLGTLIKMGYSIQAPLDLKYENTPREI